MIKINLLPAYINQRKRLKVAIAFVTLLLVAEIAGALVYRQGPLQEQQDLMARQQKVDADLLALQAVATEATTVNAEEASFKPKFEFVDNLEKFNSRTPTIYLNTAAYTYRDAMLLSMNANGQQMAMSAYVSKPDDVARLLLGLSHNPEFSGLPTITGNPGYDPTQERLASQSRDLNARSTIINGMTMGGGTGGPPPGFAGMMGGGTGGPPPGFAGMMGGGTGGPPPGMAGMAGMMGGMGMRGGMMGGGAGGGRGDLNVLPIQGSRLTPRGFTVNISAVLAYPSYRPSYGTSDSQAGGAGGGGGMMGGMGGMMGGGAMMMPGAQMSGMGARMGGM